ncbi:MAG: hypothetical protein JRH20_25815, partial [Deltaproteobacteria bacterium]|nr:hypothetical protein [Deltaproteobacteria bacterium]
HHEGKAAIQSGPWTVEVLEGHLYRGGEAPDHRRVAFSVRTSGPEAATAPRYFSLRRGELTAPPRAWQRQGPTKALLIFPWLAGPGELRLRFSPPSAPALEIEAPLEPLAPRAP